MSRNRKVEAMAIAIDPDILEAISDELEAIADQDEEPEGSPMRERSDTLMAMSKRLRAALDASRARDKGQSQ